MASIAENEMYHNIKDIARSLNRIANVLEADEKRKRTTYYQTWAEDQELAGNCSHEGCLRPVIAMINHDRFCRLHLDEAFERLGVATKAVRAGFDAMEGKD